MGKAVMGRALPTLLGSRRSGAESEPKGLRSRPAPPALDFCVFAVPEVHVKNTFIHVPASPVLSTLHRQHALLTCPSALVGSLADDGHFTEQALCTPHYQIATPFGSTPFGAGDFGDTFGVRAPPLSESTKQVLSLANALETADVAAPQVPAPDEEVALPSVGSAGHAAGACQPCAFVHAGRCNHGPACSFCHLCGPEERKRRKREKLEMRRAARAAEGSQMLASRQLCMPR